MTNIYADLKPTASADYLNLVQTKDAALLPADEYAVAYQACKTHWDGFAAECQNYYQHQTNEDLSKWTDRNRHVGHNSVTTARLDDWCASDEGQSSLARLGEGCIDWLNKNGDAGAPGHDRRHVMFKDVAEGRRFAEEDNIAGHNLCFFIGSLMHDSGRLLEERLSGTTLSGVAGEQHPYWSAEITAKLMEREPEMPQEIKNDILLSILAHQAGQTNWHFMSQAVQRGDRIGGLATPELFSRSIQMDVMELDMDLIAQPGAAQAGLIALPGTSLDDNLLSHIEFYTRFLFPNVGSKAEERTNEMRAINLAAIMLGSTPEEETIRFALEDGKLETAASPIWAAALKPARILPKVKIPAGIYKRAGALALEYYGMALNDKSDIALRELLAQSITRAGSNVSAKGVARLGDKVDGLAADEKGRLLAAIGFIEQQRDALDLEDKAILARPSGVAFVDAISKGALAIAERPPTELPNPEGLFRVALQGPMRPADKPASAAPAKPSA